MSFYNEYYVNNTSQRFVNKLWSLNNTNGLELGPKSILPNGCFNLAFIEHGGVVLTTKNKKYHLGQGGYLCSQMTSKVHLELSSNTKIIIIQLHAWSLSTFLDIDLSRFCDRIVRVNKAFLSDHFPIKLNKLASPQILVKDIDTYFNTPANKPSKNFIENICRDVLTSHGKQKVKDIAAKSNCSIRKLQTNFKQATGLTLKQYIDIVRLRAAVDDITTESKSDQKMTNISMSYDYFDQTHFTKTFKKIVKCTPTSFNKHNFLLSHKKK